MILMSKKIPFYLNTEDNAHCAPAVFKSLIEYFMNETLSWLEMDELGHSVPGKGTWTAPYHLKLAQGGVEVVIIEQFDYKKFAKDGLQYLETLGEKGEFYINHSNWSESLSSIKPFIDRVRVRNHNAHIGEIDELLEGGYLVGVELNSKVINGKDGFTLHYVLVKSKQGDDYIINDPGGLGDGYENRIVDRATLMKAIGGEFAQYEVAGFRRL